MIKNDNFALFLEEYETKRRKDFEEHEQNKNKMIGGVFRASYYNDNNFKTHNKQSSHAQYRPP